MGHLNHIYIYNGRCNIVGSFYYNILFKSCQVITHDTRIKSLR